MALDDWSLYKTKWLSTHQRQSQCLWMESESLKNGKWVWSTSARVIVLVGVFFTQDLFFHAATLNSDQSKEIVDACDYLWLSYWRSMAHSTSCPSCWRSINFTGSFDFLMLSCYKLCLLYHMALRTVLSTLYTKSAIIVPAFNTRTPFVNACFLRVLDQK